MCSTKNNANFCYQCNPDGTCAQEVATSTFISIANREKIDCSILQMTGGSPFAVGNLIGKNRTCSVVCPKANYAFYDELAYPRC